MTLPDDELRATAAEDMAWFAEQFEDHRPRLRAVAHQMLGSVTEADDALQEAWIRTTRSDKDTINNLTGWLVTLVGRVCIDMLRSRRSRREDVVGNWLPQPVFSTSDVLGPEEASLLADSVGLAPLVVLECLEPAEWLAFVLHDKFAVPFAEIAPVVERSPATTRQLASRARRRLRGSRTVPDRDTATQRPVVDAFPTASRAGDFEELLKVLDPSVVFRVGSGTRLWRSSALLVGAVDVATHASVHGPRFATLCEPALVNGAAGIVARTPHGVHAVVGLTVIDGLVAENRPHPRPRQVLRGRSEPVMTAAFTGPDVTAISGPMVLGARPLHEPRSHREASRYLVDQALRAQALGSVGTDGHGRAGLVGIERRCSDKRDCARYRGIPGPKNSGRS